MKMCKLAIAGEEGMSVSDIEVTRGGDSYLVDTMTELRMVLTGEFWFVAGSDAMVHFLTWKDPERILRLCRIALVARPGADLENLISKLGPEIAGHIDIVETSPKHVSSSNIRDMVYRGDAIDRFVSPDVARVIEETGLYKD